MSTYTPKFSLEEMSYGLKGWNAIMTANLQKLDAAIPSRVNNGTAGEALFALDALFFTAGTWRKAQANGWRGPARGLAVDTVDSGEALRVCVFGSLATSGWDWSPGAALYLSPASPGGLTQTRPSMWAQEIGFATAATSIFIAPAPVFANAVMVHNNEIVLHENEMVLFAE